jgi:hypothetical protein
LMPCGHSGAAALLRGGCVRTIHVHLLRRRRRVPMTACRL